MTKQLKDVLIIIGITIAVYLGMKYILPVIIPFLIAFVIVLWINPLIERIHKRFKINRGLLATVIIILTVGILFFILRYLLVQLFGQIKIMFTNMDVMESQLLTMLDNCCSMLENVIGVKAVSIRTFMVDLIEKFENTVTTDVIPNMMNESFNYLKGCMEVITVVVIIFISVILLVKDMERLKTAARKSYYYQFAANVCKRIIQAGGTYIRAQFTIMGVISVVCIIGLLLLRNPYAILGGLGIGLLDALPVFGTGIVFFPLVIIKILEQDFFHAACYGILWFITWLTREFLEPKLIGKRLGLYPIAVIMTIYIGIYIFGISGVLLGPLMLLMILEVSREIGVISQVKEEGEDNFNKT